MPWRWADGPFLPEEGIPFDLNDTGSCNVGGNRVNAHDQATVAPRVPSAEMVGSDAVKKRCQHYQDVESGSAPYMGKLPDGT